MIEPTECEQIGPLVELFRDGVLEETSRASVEAHLKICAACAEDERFWSGVTPEALFPEHRPFEGEGLARPGPWTIRRRSPAPGARAWVVGRGGAVAAVAAAAAVVVVVNLATASRTPPAESFGSGQVRGQSSEQPPTLPADAYSPAALEVLSAGDVTIEGGGVNSAVESSGRGR